MPGSSQLLGPTTHERNDLKIVSEHVNRYNLCSKGDYYIARAEIEGRSPSQKDGIDSSKEYELRKSYCTFLKDLGGKLRMPHIVIATSTVFSHRFFLHQSHCKNDRFTIATACMFLAGKVEEARRTLEDVVLVSYCLQNKDNPMASQEFKETEVCERQKELVLLAEHMVLVTLDFELKVRHPHSFVLLAASELKISCQGLVPVSYIILNDVLYTTLCLQFRPQHIAVSALLLAAKLLKFKFPVKNWWKRFCVTRHQLDEICNQILELYEMERMPYSMVPSGSSSSSVDDKSTFLRGPASGITTVSCQNHHTEQDLLTDDREAIKNVCVVERSHHKFTSSAQVAGPVDYHRPQMGFKEASDVCIEETDLAFRETKTPARKKRPHKGYADLQAGNRQKIAATAEKTSDLL